MVGFDVRGKFNFSVKFLAEKQKGGGGPKFVNDHFLPYMVGNGLRRMKIILIKKIIYYLNYDMADDVDGGVPSRIKPNQIW